MLQFVWNLNSEEHDLQNQSEQEMKDAAIYTKNIVISAHVWEQQEMHVHVNN
jgi:hypothetical protein